MKLRQPPPSVRAARNRLDTQAACERLLRHGYDPRSPVDVGRAAAYRAYRRVRDTYRAIADHVAAPRP